MTIKCIKIGQLLKLAILKKENENPFIFNLDFYQYNVLEWVYFYGELDGCVDYVALDDSFCWDNKMVFIEKLKLCS